MEKIIYKPMLSQNKAQSNVVCLCNRPQWSHSGTWFSRQSKVNS